MVQVLGRIPSFGENFANQFTKGLAGGVDRGLSSAEKLAGSQAKQLAARQKLAGRAYKDIPTWEKNLNISLRPEERQKMSDIYSDMLMAHPNLPEGDALQLSYNTLRAEEESARHDAVGEHSKRLFNFGAKTPFQHWIPEKFKSAGSAIKERPSLLATEAPTAAAKSFENLVGGFSLPQEMVEKHLKEKGLEAPSWLKPRKNLAEVSAEYFRKDLPEHLREGAENISDIGSVALDLAPIGKAAKLFGGVKNALMGKAKSLGSKIAPAEVAAAEFSPIKQAVQELSLEGRITKAPKTGTELRIHRSVPQAKIYPEKHIAQVRKEQLKAYPKYSEEIAKDATERAARREARIPKTPVGEAGLAKRIAIAEQKLPKLQNAYSNALTRVRSLEDQFARLPKTQQEQYKKLYEVAKDELKEAQIDFKNGLSNIRAGGSKATIEDSVSAARQKLLSIEDSIDAGKEVKLSGHDYSPRMIEEAKALKKKKPLPHTKADDFYQQIHETYLAPYRQRLGDLEKQISNTKAMFSSETYPKLKKEYDIVKKMIDSAEAEQVIHNHKLALREISERKRASDRFGTLKPGMKEPKTAKVADENMWRNQIKNARSSEERAKIIGEGIEDIAGSHPEIALEIRKEGKNLKDQIDLLMNNKSMESLKTTLKDISNKYPKLSRFGADMLIGAGTAVMDEVFKQTESPITFAAIGSTLGVSKLRGGRRLIGNQLAKHFIKNAKISQAKKQYLSNDMEERRKFMAQSPKVRKKVLEELRTN